MSQSQVLLEDNHQVQQQQPLQQRHDVASKLINDIINDCIPYIEKTAYLEAFKQSPHLIEKETNPLRFLKYDQWNAWAAAQRTVKYWEWKRTLFGEDRTFNSITDLTGIAGALDENEVAFVRTGFIAILPKDEDGNVYTFMNRSRSRGCNPFDSFDTAKKCRLYFYFLCNAVDYYYDNQHNSMIVSENDSDVQKKKETGIIVLHLISSLPRNPTRDAPDMMNQAMPIRFIRMHVIFYPENTNYYCIFERFIIPTFLTLNAPFINGYTNICYDYCSSPDEAVPLLQQYHIPLYCIPSVLGGLWSCDSFDNWFMNQSLLQQRTNPINSTTNNVVSNQVQQQKHYHQSTPENYCYLYESGLPLYQSNIDLSSCNHYMDLSSPKSMEEISQNSNYVDNLENNPDEFVICDEDFDILNESFSTVVSFVNCSEAISNNTIATTTASCIDRSLYVQQQLDNTTSYKQLCNIDDRVNNKSEYDDNNNTLNSNKISSAANNSDCTSTGWWSEKFRELCKYREQMGHCLVPQMYPENVTLGAWVKRQRYQYKLMIDGKPSHMTNERVKALTDIGFVWDSQSVVWYNLLYELQIFQQTFHHCNVPASYIQNQKLATWVQRQRRHYKLYCENNLTSTMTPERIYELEKLGFEWDGLHKK